MLTERTPGTMVEWETRAEANESVDRVKRRWQIADVLRGTSGMTASEISHEMHRRGWVPTPERNFAAPRLTEMMHDGIVEAYAKKPDPWTGKNVAVYRLRGGTVYELWSDW